MSDTIKTIIAYAASPWEHALSVLRLAGPLEHAGLHLIKGNDLLPETQAVADADLVVIQRDFSRDIANAERIVARARQLGKPIIFELDDLIWELPDDHPDRQNHYYFDSLLPMLQTALNADAVTVSTSALADYMRSINPNVWVLGNYLNETIWQWRPPVSPPDSIRPVVIGYIGGMNTHEHDLQTIAPALERLLQHYGNQVVFEFWGTRPPQSLLNYPNVRHTPLAIPNYRQYATHCATAQFDLAIAPLQANLFNRCKSAVKFFEYTALGIPVVGSPLDAYNTVITHGVNGLLATTQDEWYASLCALIDNPQARTELARAAQATVQTHWRLTQHAHDWIDSYEMITRSDRAQSAEPQSIERVVQSFMREYQEWRRTANQNNQAQIDQIKFLESRLMEQEIKLNEIYQSRSWQAASRLGQIRQRLQDQFHPSLKK